MCAMTTAFDPDWISPPGDTIADLLEERDWTQAELANRLGASRKYVNQLISGKVPLSESAAVKLERVLGSTVRFWLNREAGYRAALARKRSIESLREDTPWLDEDMEQALAAVDRARARVSHGRSRSGALRRPIGKKAEERR